MPTKVAKYVEDLDDINFKHLDDTVALVQIDIDAIGRARKNRTVDFYVGVFDRSYVEFSNNGRPTKFVVELKPAYFPHMKDPQGPIYYDFINNHMTEYDNTIKPEFPIICNGLAHVDIVTSSLALSRKALKIDFGE